MEPPAPSSVAVASISLPGGHRVDFFAPPDGPIAVAEVGPKGTPRVVDEDTLARKKPSEIYSTLKGAGAVPPPALIEAEKRLAALAAKPAPLPGQTEGGGGQGPDDTADQQWFKDTFCKAGWECLQYWSWANSSSGHHTGRGYAANGMNGREARGARTLETDWWNGSSWSTLVTESMPPGWWAWTTGGNTGAAIPCGGDPTWYFKSEIPDNGTGDNAAISLADHMFAPGGTAGGNSKSCYDVPPCNCACGCPDCPVGRGAGNNFYCKNPGVCIGDDCVNPP
jgi:hypothetical protein